MKYLLIMQVNQDVLEALSEDERKLVMDGHGAFLKTVQDSGEFVFTQALAHPANSTVVSGTGGVPAVTDGPFVEAKEFVGGFYLVDCESKKRAIELAQLIPDTRIKGLSVEVRPAMDSCPGGLNASSAPFRRPSSGFVPPRAVSFGVRAETGLVAEQDPR